MELIISSVAFGVGGAFMKQSAGCTRVAPTTAVIACFVLGAVFMTRAVRHANLATTYMVGLGIEAVFAVGVGLLMLDERLTSREGIGILVIGVGLALLRL